MPSYRAEKSKTSRHLSEYTHVEAELVDITFSQLMESMEGLIRSVVTEFYSVMLPFIRKIHPEFTALELNGAPFKRIRYAEAIEFLRSKDHRKPDGTHYEMMDDICDASEKFLVKEYADCQPVFLTHFPTEHKPFYMRRTEEGFTESCDLLFPEIGEVAGASMRCDSYDELIKGFEREGLPIKPYEWYLDMSKYGPCPHGGYGIGFERIMMSLMKYGNVDEATLYPRKATRCAP